LCEGNDTANTKYLLFLFIGAGLLLNYCVI